MQQTEHRAKERHEADMHCHKQAEVEKCQVYSAIMRASALYVPDFGPAQKPAKQVPPRESPEKSGSIGDLGNRQGMEIMMEHPKGTSSWPLAR
jgi:hypothetical protein